MMNLLIGNGLNLTNKEENSFLKNKDICDRFEKNLIEYNDIINKLVYLNDLNLHEVIEQLDFNDGIEKIAGKTFEYIYNKVIMQREFTWNDAYRLVEILGEISIKSIFFNDNKFCIPKISNEYKNKIKGTYDNVFTLNYIEDWDELGKVKYLHGNLKEYVTEYSDIGSLVLSHNKEYINFKKSQYKKINFKDIVFMPINDIVNKHNYIIQGLYPRKNLYAAEDLLLYSGRDIYKELDELEDIEVFGMSPDGDETIINRIKNIKNKKIYVYELNEREIEKWKNFGIDGCFVDSTKFLENKS